MVVEQPDGATAILSHDVDTGLFQLPCLVRIESGLKLAIAYPCIDGQCPQGRCRGISSQGNGRLYRQALASAAAGGPMTLTRVYFNYHAWFASKAASNWRCDTLHFWNEQEWTIISPSPCIGSSWWIYYGNGADAEWLLIPKVQG
jgi:hypothetical protein